MSNSNAPAILKLRLTPQLLLEPDVTSDAPYTPEIHFPFGPFAVRLGAP